MTDPKKRLRVYRLKTSPSDKLVLLAEGPDNEDTQAQLGVILTRYKHGVISAIEDSKTRPARTHAQLISRKKSTLRSHLNHPATARALERYARLQSIPTAPKVNG